MASLEEGDQLEPNEIEAAPTKALFVDILTRDIGLDRAILDLVDNCIDGARRLRPAVGARFDGLRILIRCDATKFEIEDNCGGIPVELAQKYAFRFGRAEGMEPTPGSIGQFGVGMKRSLFKLGNAFKVRSKTRNDQFTMTVNVREWMKEPKWRFKFDSMETGCDIPEEETGTWIQVTSLNEQVAASFATGRFQTALGKQIEATQQDYIDRGLAVMFAGRTLLASPWKVLHGQGIEPAYDELSYALPEKDPVHVRLSAGVGVSAPREAGWYIICNGRVVIEADQTPLTGWGSTEETETILPKFHNQYARFRGFAFFDSEDASLLPWTTTKTGVDEDSGVFRATREKMISMMRPIIDFLNDVDSETDNPPSDRPLTSALARAYPIIIRNITERRPFARPAVALSTGPEMIRISYKKDKEQVEELRSKLGTRGAADTGEKAFDLCYLKYVEG